MTSYLDRLAELVGCGSLLEIGSGPGWDAEYLESKGVQVIRTDATAAFITRLQAAGLSARHLDIRVDPLGGPYNAVMANAVLHHLTRDEFAHALQRMRDAVTTEGVLGFTVKEGEGDGWTEAKLGIPRHFTYWREAAVRDALVGSRWDVLVVNHVTGREEPWLHVIASAA